MTDIPLVAFDLGGVLLRICRTWEQGCAAAGVAFRPPREDAPALARRHALLEAYQEGRASCDAFYAGYAEALGGGTSPEDVRRVHDAWLLGEYPEVGTLVDALHRAGVDTGVLSNTNASHWARTVPRAGAPPEFPTAARTRHPHASHLLGLAKPSRAVYDRFAALTRRAPGAIVFFDDLEDNVEAARRAGWRAHRVDPDGDPAAEMTDRLRAEGLLP